MGWVCVSNHSGRTCNLQGWNAGHREALIKAGRNVILKIPESKERSLKSVSFTVQQHKNEVPDKQRTNREVNKCNQQWKHPKTFEKMKTWKNETM